MTLEQPAILTPSQAREVFRTGEVPATTSGWCHGYVQAGLLAVPRDLAFDTLLFTLRNPAPCPLLEVAGPGEPRVGEVASADLRTDLAAYRVYEHGEPVAEVPDVTEYWRDDLVAFLIGSGNGVETALTAAGVPLRHVEQGRLGTPAYVTTYPCRDAGRLSGPLVVSMRPVPAELVGLAAEVTAGHPVAHGAPVHAGDPYELGIASTADPDFGEAVEFEPGDVPVFWASGMTARAAVLASAPSLVITHAPGRMLITDRTDESLTQ